ncbi:hypothetical protein YQE_09784, partial [Dendroctonus ponderosae]
MLQLSTQLQAPTTVRPPFEVRMWQNSYGELPLLSHQVLPQVPLEAAHQKVRFKCSNCPRSYKHRKHLTHHLKYQCGKTPTLSCPYCPVKFFHKYHLKPHTKRMHRIDFEG